jgi:hypothetical protein
MKEEHKLRVFDNMILKRLFGPKRDEVTREWRRLHNEETHNWYSSPDIIKQIKSGGMKWAGLVVRMGDSEKCTRFWLESPKERDLSEDRGVVGRKDLTDIGWGVWSGFSWLRIGTGRGLLCPRL